jgi:hypothetical protein
MVLGALKRESSLAFCYDKKTGKTNSSSHHQNIPSIERQDGRGRKRPPSTEFEQPYTGIYTELWRNNFQRLVRDGSHEDARGVAASVIGNAARSSCLQKRS